MIFGTCDHIIDLEWFESKQGEVMIKSTNHEGQKIISQEVLCPLCREIALKNNLIIRNDNEAKKYLS